MTEPESMYIRIYYNYQTYLTDNVYMYIFINLNVLLVYLICVLVSSNV